MIDPKELADALAAIPPATLCAVIDGARRKAQEEREKAEQAEREKRRLELSAGMEDLRESAAAARERHEAERMKREIADLRQIRP